MQVSLYCFFCRFLSVHEILALLEEEDRDAKVYIEPNDLGLLTDEDSADEDDSGLVDNNLSGRQLSANAEAVFNNRHCTTENDEVQLTGDDKVTFLGEYYATENDNETCNALPTMSSKTAKWSLSTSLTPGDCVFPKANYMKYRDFFPVQLFELFLMRNCGIC